MGAINEDQMEGRTNTNEVGDNKTRYLFKAFKAKSGDAGKSTQKPLVKKDHDIFLNEGRNGLDWK